MVRFMSGSGSVYHYQQHVRRGSLKMTSGGSSGSSGGGSGAPRSPRNATGCCSGAQQPFRLPLHQQHSTPPTTGVSSASSLSCTPPSLTSVGGGMVLPLPSLSVHNHQHYYSSYGDLPFAASSSSFTSGSCLMSCASSPQLYHAHSGSVHGRYVPNLDRVPRPKD